MFEFTEMQRVIKKLTRQIAEGELLRKVKVTVDGHEETLELRRALDESDQYPLDFIKKLGAAGILSVFIQENYGGMGEGITGLCLATEEVARICPASSTAYAANGLGAMPIVLFGTEEQKTKYLPKIAAGENLAAFGLTESSAGSDALALKTTAIANGKFFVLNGEKIFISNGQQAGIYVVFAVTNPQRGSRGISGFIVEKGTAGFTFGKNEIKMGLHASATCSLIFSECVIPQSNLLGEREGTGAIAILNTLHRSRIGVGAQAVGAAQGAFEAALDFAQQRKQFGRPIYEFQAVAHKLINMLMKIEAARALVYKAAWYADHGADKDIIAKFGAMAKCFSSDIAQEAASEAVQIFGGCGYMREYPVEKFMRDVKVFQIYEGTNEVQRNEIINILIKEAINLRPAENLIEAGTLHAVERLFYRVLLEEKEISGHFNQCMQHRFADLAMKLESARALDEKSHELVDDKLLMLSESYSGQIIRETSVTLGLFRKGFYSKIDEEHDNIAKFLKEARFK